MFLSIIEVNGYLALFTTSAFSRGIRHRVCNVMRGSKFALSFYDNESKRILYSICSLAVSVRLII